MSSKPLLPITLTIALFLSACTTPKSADQTSTPAFFTATLPHTSAPESTFTPPPPTELPIIAPITGTTSTQVNVRAEPSTTSATLGMILPFTPIQVTGKDASGTWYQLVYPEGSQSKGWIIAAYVQISAGAEVPVIQLGAGSGSGGSVLVVQQVNVRTGPGTQFETIGMLSPKDVVALTGKDSSGVWLQIEYAAGPEARGWISAEFVQASGAESLPVVSKPDPATGTQVPAESPSTPLPMAATAFGDGDSAEAPSIAVAFSPIGARVLQFSSEVSAPEGDREDWVQFTPYHEQVEIRITCSRSSALSIQLLSGGMATADNLACGETRAVTVQVGGTYLIHLAAGDEGNAALIAYTVTVKQLP